MRKLYTYAMNKNVECLPDEAVMSLLIKNKEMDIFCVLAKKELGVEPIREYQFHDSRKWRFDYAFVAEKVALEVEGGVHTAGRHIRPKGFLNDMEKYNTAATLGWLVLRTTPDRLRTFETIGMIRAAININMNGKDAKEGLAARR